MQRKNTVSKLPIYTNMQCHFRAVYLNDMRPTVDKNNAFLFLLCIDCVSSVGMRVCTSDNYKIFIEWHHLAAKTITSSFAKKEPSKLPICTNIQCHLRVLYLNDMRPATSTSCHEVRLTHSSICARDGYDTKASSFMSTNKLWATFGSAYAYATK